jgi:uncharacterized protein (DUF302 family)
MKYLFAGAFAVILALSASAASADQGLVIIESANGVTATADKLEKILKSKGLTVFARIDHAAGAKKVGKSLRPTQLLIFGNPKLGTPLMASNQAIGIDLPQKALIYLGTNGKTYIAYNKPAYLAKRHSIGDRDKVFKKITGALKNLTAAAAKK